MLKDRLLSCSAFIMILVVLVISFALVEASETKSLRSNIQQQLKINEQATTKACPYNGDYCNSCIDCYEYGGWLVCKCYYSNGVLDGGTRIDLKVCNGGYIMNISTDLACFKEAPKDCPYPGNYCKSCQNCYEWGGTLVCQCYDDNKVLQGTTLSLYNCPYGVITAFKGALVCVKLPISFPGMG